MSGPSLCCIHEAKIHNKNHHTDCSSDDDDDDDLCHSCRVTVSAITAAPLSAGLERTTLPPRPPSSSTHPPSLPDCLPAFLLTLQLYDCSNALQMKRGANPPQIIDKSSPRGAGMKKKKKKRRAREKRREEEGEERRKSPDKQTACVLSDSPLRNSSVDK